MDKIVNLSLARKSVPTLIDVVQGTTAPNIVFVLEDYTPPSNARARLYIKKTNAEVYNDCVLSGNQITYTPTAGSFDEEGQCVAQLEIVQGNTIAVSWRIFVTVEPNLIEGSAAPASTEYGALESLIINAQQYDTIIGANNLTGANNRQGWTALTSGQDLNTVLGVGTYYANSAGIYNSVLNSPMTGKAFRLDVQYSVANNNYMRHIWTANTGEQFIRGTTNGGSSWSDWRLTPTRSEVNAIANQGAKNLAKSDGATSTTLYGVTFTKNADGSVTANGTATANATFYIDSGYYSDLQGESLTLSGCPEGGSTTTYRIAVIRSGSAIAIDYGNGITFNGRDNQRVGITIFTGYTANNITFYPMLRYSSIQDDTYVPYGISNAELTARVYQTGTNGVYNLDELQTSQVLGNADSTNTPVANAWFFVETFMVDNNGAIQRATGFYPTTVKGKVYSRVKQGGTWSEWTQL